MSKKSEKKSTVLAEDKSPKPVVNNPVVVAEEMVTVTKTEYEDLKKELAEIKTIVKGFKKELKGLVEIQQRLVHERLGAAVPLPPKEYGEETSSKSVGIELSSTSDDRIKITGKKSFDIKETIKQSAPFKAKFNAGDKSWSIPSEYLDALIANLEAINLVKDKDFSVNVTKGKTSAGSTTKKEEDSDTEDGGFGSGFS
jgi:hypothetical protein